MSKHELTATVWVQFDSSTEEEYSRLYDKFQTEVLAIGTTGEFDVWMDIYDSNEIGD